MELTGAEIIIECLKAEKIDYVFGYPGGAVLHIYDAFYKQEDVQHILVRHEQGATHAADGYARSTGKAGVVLVTSGPWRDECSNRYRNSLYGFDPDDCYHRAGAKSPDW